MSLTSLRSPFAGRDRGFVCPEGKFAFLALTRLFKMVMMESAGAKRVREGFMTSGEQSKYERPAIVALRPPIVAPQLSSHCCTAGTKSYCSYTPNIHTDMHTHSPNGLVTAPAGYLWSPSNLHLSNLT